MQDSEDQIRAKDELSQKNVAFYQAMLGAFIESRNEFDKQLLTISVAALGFLLSSSEKLISNSFSLFILVLSALLYLATIIGLLRILTLNARYIEKELKSDAEAAGEVTKTLDQNDKLVRWSFGTALALTVVLFLIIIFNEGDKKMSNTSNGEVRSLSGVGTLKPAPTNTTHTDEATSQGTTTAEKPKETK